jgi:hypothetical protein
MKRENELLDAVKSSNTSSVQRILSKCRSGKSSKLKIKIFQDQFNSLDIVSPKKLNLNFQDDNG